MTKARPPRIICPMQATQITDVIPRAWNRGGSHSITERKCKRDDDFKQSWNFTVNIKTWRMSKIQSVYLLSTELFVMMLETEKPARKRREQYRKNVGAKAAQIPTTASTSKHHLTTNLLPNLRDRSRLDMGILASCCGKYLKEVIFQNFGNVLISETWYLKP